VEIVTVPIENLILDPSNARKHGEKNLEAIKGSLSRFGQQKPIVIKDGVVVAGNGTLEAAKRLGWSHVHVVETNLSGADLVAYGIADNRTGEISEWNDGVLSKLLLGLQGDDYDLKSIGFDEDDLKSLLSDEEPIKVENEKQEQFRIVIECSNETERSDLVSELEERSIRYKIP